MRVIFLLLAMFSLAFAREWKYEGTWSKCEDGLQTFHSEKHIEMDGYRRPCPPCKGSWSECKDGKMTFQTEDESECSVIRRERKC